MFKIQWSGTTTFIRITLGRFTLCAMTLGRIQFNCWYTVLLVYIHCIMPALLKVVMLSVALPSVIHLNAAAPLWATSFRRFYGYFDGFLSGESRYEDAEVIFNCLLWSERTLVMEQTIRLNSYDQNDRAYLMLLYSFLVKWKPIRRCWGNL